LAHARAAGLVAPGRVRATVAGSVLRRHLSVVRGLFCACRDVERDLDAGAGQSFGICGYDRRRRLSVLVQEDRQGAKGPGEAAFRLNIAGGLSCGSSFSAKVSRGWRAPRWPAYPVESFSF